LEQHHVDVDGIWLALALATLITAVLVVVGAQ